MIIGYLDPWGLKVELLGLSGGLPMKGINSYKKSKVRCHEGYIRC